MTKEKKLIVIERLEKLYPDPKPALIFTDAYELLVSVVLSAQCTDERVNKVTAKLFELYNTPQKMITLNVDSLGKLIFSCGFYRVKAEHILQLSKDIIEKFDGQVPDNLEDLQKLAGVGRKTANVVFSVWFKGDAIAVDTHVFRVSNRIGLAKATNVLDTEKQLQKSIPKTKWSKSHHYLIFLGRNTCKAQRPLCEECVLFDICEKNNLKK